MPGFKFPSDEACGFGPKSRKPQTFKKQYGPRESTAPHPTEQRGPVYVDIPKGPIYASLELGVKELLDIDASQVEAVLIKQAPPSDWKKLQYQFDNMMKLHPDAVVVWLADQSAYLVWKTPLPQ